MGAGEVHAEATSVQGRGPGFRRPFPRGCRPSRAIAVYSTRSPFRRSAADETPRSRPSPAVAASRGVVAVVPVRPGRDGVLRPGRGEGNIAGSHGRGDVRRVVLRVARGSARPPTRFRRPVPAVRPVRGRMLRDEGPGLGAAARDPRRLDRGSAARDARRGRAGRVDPPRRTGGSRRHPDRRPEGRTRPRRFRARTARGDLRPDHLNHR